MATQLKNLSETTLTANKEFKKARIGIVVSQWNEAITQALLQGAMDFLLKMDVKPENIVLHFVPGSFELPLGAKWLIEQCGVDAAIALGCVIQGETRHFDFVCDACANGIMQVGLQTGKPAIFGVLTTNTLEQAQARAGGQHGNKGTEAAETALRMWLLQRSI